MKRGLSLSRISAMAIKEFIQIWRDKGSFGMVFLLPVMQLILFGFAINSDPKNLPLAVVSGDQSSYVRTVLAGLQNSGYFRLVAPATSVAEADALMAKGEVQFVLSIPENFSRDLLRGQRPVLLMEADASDPVAVGNALSALKHLSMDVLDRDLKNRPSLLSREPPFDVRVHNRYNPEGLTAYNIVPGLLAVLLNMTLVALTAVAMTRERERGTLENLLATPIRPFEVMVGKIAPFIIIAYVQLIVILLASWLLFRVPILGNPFLLASALSLYIAANLAIGFTISTFARNQLQAMQMAFFYFLPSMLLSGFMFPFRGMPEWAQAIGSLFPITHALRIIRGVVLKGNGLAEIAPSLWPIGLFLVVISFVAMKRYRETID